MSLVERVLQRDPAGRLRRHGLPQPRPLPARGGGAGRAAPARRRCAWRCARWRARARPRRAGARRPRGPRRLPPHRQGPPRTSRPTSPTARGSRQRVRRFVFAPRHRRLPRLDRRSSPRSWSAPACAYARGAGRARLGRRWRSRCCCSCPPATWPSPSCSGWPRAWRRRAGCRASSSPAASPTDARTMVDRAHAAHQRGRGERAGRAPRGAGPRQPRPAHPLRDPGRLHGRARARHAGGRGDPGRGPGGHRGPEPPAVGEGRGDRFFLFHRARQWNPREGVLDGLGAQAREDRGVQPPAARRHRHQLRRPARRPGDPAPASATASRSTPTPACRATRPRSSSASSRTR